MDNADRKARKAAAIRQGVVVAIVLAVLTAIEYVVGVVWPAAWLLLLIGLIKAVAVVQYYMHVSYVFTGGGEH